MDLAAFFRRKVCTAIIMDGPLNQLKQLKFMFWIILLSTAILCPGVPLKAQSFKFDGKRTREAINFKRIKNLIVIPVYINEQGPYNFLLDTGVGQMIITDTTFLKILNVKQFKTYKIQGYGLGTEIEAILTRNVSARVGKSAIKNIPTAIFKEDIFDLSSYLGIKIHGILGYYFFNSFIVKINYSTNKLTYYSHHHKTKIKGAKIPLRIINAKPYITAEVGIDSIIKTNVNLLVDNGSSHPLMLEAIGDRPFPVPKHTIKANLGVGINGEINGVMGRIHTLKINEFTFNHILSGFPTYSVERTELEGTARNGSLGAEVLKHFLVTFDYQNEALYLKKSNFFKRKFDHDMSGMEIYMLQQPKDRYFISRIEPGSPAEKVGLSPGDEILSVDFRTIEHYTLNELTELFREHDGKQMLLEVVHKNERRIVLLRLKRRI
jgi:hypothetical protein